MENFIQVPKEDFEKFVKEYPNKLDYDEIDIYHPPIGSYNDFANGEVWPKSTVAKVVLYSNDPYFNNKPSEYFIKMLVVISAPLNFTL